MLAKPSPLGCKRTLFTVSSSESFDLHTLQWLNCQHILVPQYSIEGHLHYRTQSQLLTYELGWQTRTGIEVNGAWQKKPYM